MPDTYTSQFSGEEIDSALRAAQIISGASTPAELRKKLEIRGDTIPVSAEDSTLISEALTKIPTTSGGGVNPNLLDNWYFGRPVNQRNGYYIPAGVKYNTLSWTEAGTTDKAYPVIGYIGQDPLITVNGTNYIVGKSVQVPGYCTTGYTVDRWKLSQWNTDEVAAKLKKTGLNISGSAEGKANSTYIEENIDFPFAGKTVTISAIISEINKNSNTLSLFLRANNTLLHSCPIKSTGLVSTTYTFANDFDGIVGFEIGQGGSEGGLGSCDFTILAAKLELGDTQTLAHKENGVWVLNEIPDFGEQLRRCRRYCKVFPKGSDLPVLAFAQPEKWYLSAFIPFDDMRTVPANNIGSGIKCHVFSIDSDDVSASETIMNWGATPTGQKLRISDNAVSSADFPFRINLDADLIFSADL